MVESQESKLELLTIKEQFDVIAVPSSYIRLLKKLMKKFP
jgi:hypothetical protein